MRKDKLNRIVGMISGEGWARFFDKIYDAIDLVGLDTMAHLYRNSVETVAMHQKRESREYASNPWDPDRFDYDLAPTQSLAKKDFGPLRPGKRPYRPGVGFFPKSEERDLKEPASFHRAYIPISPLGSKKGPFKFQIPWPKTERWETGGMRWIETFVYRHYMVGQPLEDGEVDVTDAKLWSKITVPLVMSNVSEILISKGVAAALHELSIVFLPLHPYMSRAKKEPIHIEGQPPKIADAAGVYLGAAGFELLRLATGVLDPDNKEQGWNVINEFVQVTRDKIHEVMPSWRKGFGKSPEEKAVLAELSILIVTLLHELGHRVDQRCLEEERPKLFQAWMEYKDEENPLSTYAVESPAEWFAEAWVAWLIDGITYSKGAKEAFEDILQLSPSKFEPQALDSFTTKINAMLEDQFSSPKLKPGSSFTMKIVYGKGPPRKLSGIFVKIDKKRPLPTLVYREGTVTCRKCKRQFDVATAAGKVCPKCGTNNSDASVEIETYHLTCFPNREIKSISVLPGKDK